MISSFDMELAPVAGASELVPIMDALESAAESTMVAVWPVPDLQVMIDAVGQVLIVEEPPGHRCGFVWL